MNAFLRVVMEIQEKQIPVTQEIKMKNWVLFAFFDS